MNDMVPLVERVRSSGRARVSGAMPFGRQFDFEVSSAEAVQLADKLYEAAGVRPT